MTDAAVDFRALTAGDLPGAERLQRAEGWNQRRGDWELFLARNPDGCFAAVAGDRVVGTIASQRYGTAVAWLSLLLVDRALRGRGIGRELMRRVVAANEAACATLRLDATLEGRPMYARLGFRDDYGLARLVAERAPAELPAAVGAGGAREEPVPLQPQDLSEVGAVDGPAFGADRGVVLASLVERCPETAWVLRRRGVVAGYALGRDGALQWHVGPVVARSLDDATALIGRSVLRCEGRPVIIDVPDRQTGLLERLAPLGFVPRRRLIRMSRGAPVDELPERVYAIAGPEYG